MSQDGGSSSVPELSDENVDRIFAWIRLLQFANTLFPIADTLDGIVTLVRLLHLLNALLPIKVTLDGIVTLVRLSQSQNA